MADQGAVPRITFGLIVLNGEPFTRYCLRSLYPFAHQIIVVEGASPHAAAIATPEGHSTDGTLETLRRFKAEEDPENKLAIVTAENDGYPNGFWPGEKDEQSQAYAKRSTGDYLWQVDIDEFYREEDLRRILDALRADPEITAVSFKMITFWGGLDYWVDSLYLWGGAEIYHRLFRWRPGYRYATHRPPTVHDETGRDLRSLKRLTGAETSRMGVRLYHYSLLFPKQVMEKDLYYSRVFSSNRPEAAKWTAKCYLGLERPYRVHNVYSHLSWLQRFEGQHPPQVLQMMEDIRAGRLAIKMRQSDDIETLLGSPWYRAGRAALRAFAPLYRRRFVRRTLSRLGKLLRVKWPDRI